MPKTIIIPGDQLWDPVNNRFLKKSDVRIVVEHSLLSVSKWEQKWKVNFIGNKDLTTEQFLDYIRCMCITPNIDPEIFQKLPMSTIEEITNYIADPMTATTITEPPGKQQKSKYKILTNEVIYYWMTALQIPFDPCERWHLNRLLVLIKIASIEQQPDKKMSKADAMRQQRSLNAARRARFGTKG